MSFWTKAMSAAMKAVIPPIQAIRIPMSPIPSTPPCPTSKKGTIRATR